MDGDGVNEGARPPRGGLRLERGSLSPLYLGLMFATLAATVGLFQVGHAAVMRAGAQTAADAAALGAAQAVDRALLDVSGDFGRAFSCRWFQSQAEAAAADYAERNDAVVRDVELAASARHLCTVTVSVTSRDQLDEHWSHDRAGDAARGHARARAAVYPAWTLPSLGLPPGLTRGAGWTLSEDPETVAANLLVTAAHIAAQGWRYQLGSGHGTTPVPTTLGAYDCSSAVSMLLQQSGVAVPTMWTGAWAAAGQNPANTFVQPGRGDFLTLWVHTGAECGTPIGHMFVDLAGRGWGTSSSNPGGGPGWLSYTGPGPFPCARPYHLPHLEAGLDPTFLADLTPRGRNATRPGLLARSNGPRLIELDQTAPSPDAPGGR